MGTRSSAERADRPAAVALGFTPASAIVVTGAASGIGRATARRAAEQGLAVAAWDRDGAAVEALVAELNESGASAVAITADVGVPEQVLAAMRTTVDALGPVRYLVNNAGPSSAVEHDFDDALRISVGSVRAVTEAWLGTSVPGGAAMVNVASVAGTTVATASDWYTAAKAAIAGYTRHLAAYRAGQLRANAVAPGMVDTPRLATFASSELGRRVLGRVPAGRIAEPDEIAWTILFLLSPLASYVNGALLVVDGGWTITQ